MFSLTTSIVTTCSMLAILVPGQLAADELKYTADSMEEIKENLESKKAVLVDVREKSEWNDGHVKGAKLLPWSKLRFASPKTKVKELPNDEIIVYCYCKAGVRAMRAAKKLEEIGYDVRPIKAGFAELVKNGFESEKKK